MIAAAAAFLDDSKRKYSIHKQQQQMRVTSTDYKEISTHSTAQTIKEY